MDTTIDNIDLTRHSRAEVYNTAGAYEDEAVCVGGGTLLQSTTCLALQTVLLSARFICFIAYEN